MTVTASAKVAGERRRSSGAPAAARGQVRGARPGADALTRAGSGPGQSSAKCPWASASASARAPAASTTTWAPGTAAPAASRTVPSTRSVARASQSIASGMGLIPSLYRNLGLRGRFPCR